MRTIAVTGHAVKRYQERVEGAGVFDDESVRSIIRDLVIEGFDSGLVQPHPTMNERRIIPFKSGKSILYLSIGPNLTSFEADLAVIGVLFEHDLTSGRVGTGATLGDVAPLKALLPVPIQPPQYVVLVGGEDTIEEYRIMEKDTNGLRSWLGHKNIRPDAVHIYKLMDAHETFSTQEALRNVGDSPQKT